MKASEIEILKTRLVYQSKECDFLKNYHLRGSLLCLTFICYLFGEHHGLLSFPPELVVVSKKLASPLIHTNKPKPTMHEGKGVEMFCLFFHDYD